MKDFLKNILATFELYRNKKTYEQAIKESLILSLGTESFGNNFTDVTWDEIKEHPKHKSCINEFKKSIKYSLKLDSINFGDSLTDFARRYITSVDGIYSIGGSWHKHMLQVAQDLAIYLKRFNIKYIFIGTLGGNPLLVYQDFDKTVAYSLRVLDGIRELFKEAKIIVYGLPPAFNINVLKNTIAFDEELRQWTFNDGNASFIDLKKHLGGFFPKSRWSSDGVHLSPKGARILSDLFEAEKK